MTDGKDGGPVRDPQEKRKDKSQRTGTSGSREESMTEAGKDAFGSKSPIRKVESSSQSDGAPDVVEVTDGEQNSRSSGTASLGGESATAAERPGPGGVEGESGRS